LEDGGRVINPRKILAVEGDLSPSLLQKIKDLGGPLYVEVDDLGEIKISN
jgi:hypothetical protein